VGAMRHHTVGEAQSEKKLCVSDRVRAFPMYFLRQQSTSVVNKAKSIQRRGTRCGEFLQA